MGSKIIKTVIIKDASGVVMTKREQKMLQKYCPMRTVRTIFNDPDATDSSGDEDETYNYRNSRRRPRGKCYVTEVKFPDLTLLHATAKKTGQNAGEDKNVKKKTSDYVGIRKRLWGTFAAEIRNPITKRRVWLGSYHDEAVAACVYNAKKREYERKYGLSRKRNARKAYAPGIHKVALEEIPLAEESTTTLKAEGTAVAIPNVESEATISVEEISAEEMAATFPNILESETPSEEASTVIVEGEVVAAETGEFPDGYGQPAFDDLRGESAFVELLFGHQEIGLDENYASGNAQQDVDPLNFDFSECDDLDFSLSACEGEFFPENRNANGLKEDFSGDIAFAFVESEETPCEEVSTIIVEAALPNLSPEEISVAWLVEKRKPVELTKEYGQPLFDDLWEEPAFACQELLFGNQEIELDEEYTSGNGPQDLSPLKIDFSKIWDDDLHFSLATCEEELFPEYQNNGKKEEFSGDGAFGFADSVMDKADP